jgi:hypothetical protein
MRTPWTNLAHSQLNHQFLLTTPYAQRQLLKTTQLIYRHDLRHCPEHANGKSESMPVPMRRRTKLEALVKTKHKYTEKIEAWTNR